MIRALTIIICVCVFNSKIIAQEDFNSSLTKDSKIMHHIFSYADLFEWFCYYDDYNSYIYDSLDIIKYNFNDTNNIWNVCFPNKGDWNSGGWQPYPDTFPARVLITDSINPYPVNNLSTVEFYIIKPAWSYIYNFCWSRFAFSFQFRAETDTITDGIFVDVSFDGGQTFANIQDTSAVKSLLNGPTSISSTYFIDYRSQLLNSYGFSGNMTLGYPYSDGWYYPFFEFDWDNANAHNVDTAIVKLSFISDSINTYKRGVIIDNINIYVEDQCVVSAENNFLKYSVTLYPNPVKDFSKIEFSNPDCENFKLEIVDNNGKMIFEGETNEQQIQIGNLDLQKGIYHYRLSNKYGEVRTDKFIKLE